MERDGLLGVGLVLFVLAVIVLNVSVGVYAVADTVGNNCSVNSDCFPSGFVQTECGTFYGCLNGTCVSGSNSCAPVCKTYYYFDNTNKSCDAKEFCGAFMYSGLRTFETKEDCLSKVNNLSDDEDDEDDENETEEEEDDSKKINKSAVCTQDCPEVCCNLRGVHVTKCNKCVCEQQYGGVVIGDKKCNKTPSREELQKEIERLKKERERLKEDIKELRGNVKEIMKKNNGWINIYDRNITIRELSDEKKEIITNKINARTGLNLTAEDINNETILKALLSNGRFAEIKIMPDKASERALEVLRAKCEIRNCSIELKEVGIGNKTRLAYAIETEKASRLFLIFKNKMLVKAQVDAETGEIISVKKPWWAFIAKEEDD